MIASLAMYQRAELVDAHNRYWASIRTALLDVGIDSPEHLSQDVDEFSVWTNPSLVLSQTCGMPYRLWLHDRVALIGTPDYGLSECAPGYYRSALVVRRDDDRDTLPEFRDGVFAYNETFSQSGYAAAYQHVRGYGFWFERRRGTGQHIESARAVAHRDADIAALDAVSWTQIDRYETWASELRVLQWTSPTPGLPYIAATGVDTEAVFGAVENAIAALAEPDRDALGIIGFTHVTKSDYLAIANPPESPGAMPAH